jgi:hypothetical protein
MTRRMVGRKSAQAAAGGQRMVGRKSARAAAARPRRRPSGPSVFSFFPLLGLPVAVTLGVTLLRLGGELMGWSPRFFSAVPGGGLAIVGITWLIPFVGYYLGERLLRSRATARSFLWVGGLPLAALLVMAVGARMVSRSGMGETPSGHMTAWAGAALVAMVGAWFAWPKLGSLLVAYGLAARVPVVLVMFLAIRGQWGTHYDALPPGFPPMVPDVQWWWTGFVPQMTIWVALTVIFGLLGGAVAVYLAERRAD